MVFLTYNLSKIERQMFWYIQLGRLHNHLFRTMLYPLRTTYFRWQAWPKAHRNHPEKNWRKIMSVFCDSRAVPWW